MAQMFLNIYAKYSEKQIKEVPDKSNVKTKISGLNQGEKKVIKILEKMDFQSYKIIRN